jgi:hypothetical protein
MPEGYLVKQVELRIVTAVQSGQLAGSSPDRRPWISDLRMR